MSRTQALAAELAQAGYACTVEGRRVHVDAPAYTLAHVRLDEDDYACVFDANELHARPRGACGAWAQWTRELVTATGAIFPRLASLPLPAPVAPAPARVVARDLSECLDDFTHGPLVCDRLANAWDKIRRNEFALYMVEPAPQWSSLDSSDLEWPGQSVGWHTWARPVAVELGATVGWAQVEGDKIDDDHAAHSPVRHVLLKAAERHYAPRGLVALDLRGLAPRLAAELVTALVRAGRARTGDSAGALVCDAHTCALLARTVDLECEARQNADQSAFAW